MAGRMARRETGAMPLRIVSDEATPPDDPPRPCPRGLRRLSPAAASRRSGQYRRGYSRFACSLRQTKIIRNATPSGFGIGSSADCRRLVHLQGTDFAPEPQIALRQCWRKIILRYPLLSVSICLRLSRGLGCVHPCWFLILWLSFYHSPSGGWILRRRSTSPGVS